MTPPTSSSRPSTAPSLSGPLALAGVWITLYLALFFSFDLPNSGPPRVPRAALLANTPFLLLDDLDPPRPALDADPAEHLRFSRSGWSYFPQRCGMIAVAAAVLCGAWGLGSLALRPLRLTMLDPLERLFFELTSGLSAAALLTLALGLAGMLTRPAALLLVGVPCVAAVVTRWRSGAAVGVKLPRPTRQQVILGTLAVAPFALAILLGGLLPETDFDVKEYHFGGPKEWHQLGRIQFLPHNVYTSFPFLTEMLTLLAMTLHGDWYWGAVAGKGVLLSFAFLTALGLFAAGRRWFSPSAGLWAALIFLTPPWIYRISIIAYAEGALTCYLFAAWFAAALCATGPLAARGLPFLAGLLAGSAFGCKYPGLLTVVLPTGAALAVTGLRAGAGLTANERRRLLIQRHGAFLLGIALTAGPWLLKNAVQTGNPVYPLAWSLFGGRDWDAELDAKWRRAHSPDHYHPSDLGTKFIDVTLKSDWLSPLLFGFAPLAFLRRRTGPPDPTADRIHRWLGMYVVYLFLAWWIFTHRLDRFWVPLIPIVALRAAAGMTWTSAAAWRWPRNALVALLLAYNLAFITTALCGYNRYLLDLDLAAADTARITSPELVVLNENLPAGSVVLAVGEAELFDARFPVLYNTVFDHSLFEQWCSAAAPGVPPAKQALRPAAEIRAELAARGVTHILVNWQEILRYRTTYGYTDFVAPARFEALVAAGLLAPPWDVPAFQAWDSLSPQAQAEVQSWGPELILESPRRIRTFAVYPVRR